MRDAVAMEPLVLVEDQGSVRILRLNRPAKLNALDTLLVQALHDALNAADRHEPVRAIVLAGQGRGFCAGADLSEFKDLPPDRRHMVAQRAELTSRAQSLLQNLSKPIVSAVHGSAIGAGASIAIACDMFVAGSDLKFGYPELKHAIVPALVMTELQRALGRKQAFEMLSLGRLIGAEEAKALGLANAVSSSPVDAALEIARIWASFDPTAMTATKSLFYRVADLPYEAAMSAGRDVNAIMRGLRAARDA